MSLFPSSQTQRFSGKVAADSLNFVLSPFRYMIIPSFVDLFKILVVWPFIFWLGWSYISETWPVQAAVLVPKTYDNVFAAVSVPIVNVWQKENKAEAAKAHINTCAAKDSTMQAAACMAGVF